MSKIRGWARGILISGLMKESWLAAKDAEWVVS